MSLDQLEADSATQQAIEALVDLSRDSLDVIAWTLSELLEKLAAVRLPITRVLIIAYLTWNVFSPSSPTRKP